MYSLPGGLSPLLGLMDLLYQTEVIERHSPVSDEEVVEGEGSVVSK